MKKTPFRLTPYQVQWLLVVGFVTVGYAIYLRYLAIEFSGTALACDAGLQIPALQGAGAGHQPVSQFGFRHHRAGDRDAAPDPAVDRLADRSA